MRQCEFKRKYNHENGKNEKRYIYGAGIIDSIRNFLFHETTKKVVKEASKKAATSALNKTGKYAGNKAGDKIIQLLQKQSTNKQSSNKNPTKNKKTVSKNNQEQLSDYEINERVQRLLSGSGKIRKLKI